MSKLDQLLTIDVEAEIRKLCGRQLGDPADQVVELIRLAIRVGAQSVRVRVGFRWVDIESIGGVLPESSLRWLCATADPQLPAKDRHEALLRCEAEQGVGLLSLVTATAAVITSNNPRAQHQLRLCSGDPPRYTRRSTAAPGINIRVTREASRRQTRMVLERACRFSEVPVFLDGRTISSGEDLDACLVRTQVHHEDLVCDVGLPRSGELCQTVWLSDELVRKESFGVSPRGYVHVAVIRGPGDNIDAATAKNIVHQARSWLYDSLRAQLPRLRGADLRAARDLLFRRVERGGDEAELAGLPLFRRLSGDRVDLSALRRATRAGTVWAVEPGARRRHWLVQPESIFVLDARERELLTEHLRIACQEPPAMAGSSLVSGVRRVVRGAGRKMARGVSGLIGRALGGQPVNLASLSESERRLVAAVQSELSAGHFSLPGISARLSRRIHVDVCERGSLPLQVRRRGDRLAVVIPRRHAAVTRMVAALEREPASLLVVMAVLFAGHDGYGRAKIRWHEAALDAP